jgi:membrane-associated phospholipid phosphatase
MLELDQALFSSINGWQVPEWLDYVLIHWRNQKVWIPLYFIMIFLLVRYFKKKGILIIIFAMVVAGFSDFTNSQLIKKSVERPRPCHEVSDIPDLDLKIHCGYGYSFPSTHASNHMALSLFIFLACGKLNRKWTMWLFPWAFLVGIAQIYVGVHYPLDVLGGFIWGSMVAYAFYKIYEKVLEGLKWEK